MAQEPIPVTTTASFSDEDAVLSHLRHDLRTPFNHIIGYAEIIGEDAADADAPVVAELATALAREAHAALSVIATNSTSALQLRHLPGAMAEPLATLREALQELAKGLAAEPSLRSGTEENLQRLNTAVANLTALVTATADPDPAEPPMRAEVSESSPSVAHVVLADGILSTAATLLVVDDQAENRTLLEQRLQREGYQVVLAASGAQALEIMRAQPIDLVLLDVLMPGMDGIEVLQTIKSDDHLHRIPVIMISALNEIEPVVTCIESGAEDYLSKPFNPVLLRARIGVTLERKRLRDEEARQHQELNELFAELQRERAIAHDLLLNILPEKVAMELQQGHSAPMYFEDTTICFTDFVGFTLSTENMAAELLVEELHTFFTAFDHVMGRYNLEKMKTIGDSYMFASGLPTRHPANPVNALLAALELVHATERLAERPDAPGWQLRIGLHTGPVIAGVVGIRKFAFDVWGDSVNVASRMESCGAPNRINISERTHARVKDFFTCEPRGKVMTKDKRELEMFFVTGVQPGLLADGTFSAFARRYQLYFGEAPPSFPDFLLPSV